MWSNRAWKIGQGGVLSCVTYDMSQPTALTCAHLMPLCLTTLPGPQNLHHTLTRHTHPRRRRHIAHKCRQGNVPKSLRRDASGMAPACVGGREHPRQEGLRARQQRPRARAPHRPLARAQDRSGHARRGHLAGRHRGPRGAGARGGAGRKLVGDRRHGGGHPERVCYDGVDGHPVRGRRGRAGRVQDGPAHPGGQGKRATEPPNT